MSATGQTLYSAQFSYSGGVVSQASVVSATAGGSVSYTDSYLDGGDGRPLEFTRVQNGATSYYWYEYDGRGDVVAVTDSNGNVVDSYEYDLWGEELMDTSHEAVPQRLRAGAMWYDGEMQVQWLWDGGTNRYDDPELERYLQPDAPGGSYVFAGDDPASPANKGGTWAQMRGSTIRYSGIRPHAGNYNPSPSGVCEIPIVGGLVCPQPVPSYQEARHSYLLSVGGIFYRGATSDNPQEIWALQPSEAKKIAAGKFDRGVSVFTNPDKIPPRFHKVWKVFGNSIRMNGLDIKQVGQPEHFEITPTGPSTLEDYQVKLESIPIVLYVPGEGEPEDPRDRG